MPYSGDINTITGVWKPAHKDYLISEYGGMVYSCLSGRLLKPTTNKKTGYSYVTLKGGKKEYVHRLVMLAFHGPPQDGEVVDHIDGDRANNDEPNLRYLLKEDNDRQANRIKRRRCTYFNNLSSIYNLKGRSSSIAVAKMFNIKSPTTVSNIWNKKTWREITDLLDKNHGE